MLKLRHVLSTGAATLVGGGLSLLLAFAVARLLSPAENGHYAQYVLVMNMVFIGGNLGVGTASTYYLASGRWNLNQVRRLNLRFAASVAAGVVLTAIVLAATPAGAHIERLFKAPMAMIYFGLVGGVALLCANHCVAILMGVHRYDRANVVNTLRAGLAVPCVIAAGLFARGEVPVVLAQTVAVLAALCIAVFMIPRQSTSPQIRESDHRIGQFLRYGGLAYVSNLLHFFAMRGLLLFLSFYAAPAQVGYFSLALLMLEAMLLLPSAVGQLVFPQSSSTAFNHSLIETLLRVNLYVGIVLAALVALIATPLVALLLGNDYAPVGQALVHLAPSVVLLSVPRILSPLLSGRGHPGYPLGAAVLSTVIGVPLALALIPGHGIVGAAWIADVVAAVTGVVTVFGYCRVHGVRLAQVLLPRRSDLVVASWVQATPPGDRT